MFGALLSVLGHGDFRFWDTNGGREGRFLRSTEGGYHCHLQEFE